MGMNHKSLITDDVDHDSSEALVINLDDGNPINKMAPGQGTLKVLGLRFEVSTVESKV